MEYTVSDNEGRDDPGVSRRNAGAVGAIKPNEEPTAVSLKRHVFKFGWYRGFSSHEGGKAFVL